MGDVESDPRRGQNPKSEAGEGIEEEVMQRMSLLFFDFKFQITESSLCRCDHNPSTSTGESKMEASKAGRGLTVDFKYACVGRSVYLDGKDTSKDPQDKHSELPFCAGIEILLEIPASNTYRAPAHAHDIEGGHVFPQPQTFQSAPSIGELLLSRITWDSSVVASEVARSFYILGKHLKGEIDLLLDPDRRRPK